jgi:hypothetical protein
MTHIHTHSRVKKKKSRILTVSMPFFVGRFSLMFVLMFFIATLGVIYMVNFNENATVGYQLTKLEVERNKLKTIKEQQNIDLSKSQSLDSIRYSTSVAGMVPVSDVEYYDGNIEVALNK